MNAADNSANPLWHADDRIHAALKGLADAITTWGRFTNLRSVLIYRDESGVSVRLYDGRPIPVHVTDAELIDFLIGDVK